MFTGIVEHVGTIESLSLGDDGGRVTIHAPSLASTLAVSNSIAVNGCCLTIVSLEYERFSADLSGETIRRTSFGANDSARLAVGSRVNLEQPLTAGKEFGGHFVLGHVDGVGHVAHLTPAGEGWSFGVRLPQDVAPYVVSKGSITIDGISLTIASCFLFPTMTIQIAVIPYTYEHTNLRDRKPGDAVNLEVDILGKYVERYLALRGEESAAREKSPMPLTLAQLREEGF
jgi:riboflavin synthase